MRWKMNLEVFQNAHRHTQIQKHKARQTQTRQQKHTYSLKHRHKHSHTTGIHPHPQTLVTPARKRASKDGYPASTHDVRIEDNWASLYARVIGQYHCVYTSEVMPLSSPDMTERCKGSMTSICAHLCMSRID